MLGRESPARVGDAAGLENCSLAARAWDDLRASLERLGYYRDAAASLAVIEDAQGVLHAINGITELTLFLGDRVVQVTRGRQMPGATES